MKNITEWGIVWKRIGEIYTTFGQSGSCIEIPDNGKLTYRNARNKGQNGVFGGNLHALTQICTKWNARKLQFWN